MDGQTLEFLADMICGGGPDYPVYRTSSELTAFFERVGLSNFKHDDSTRKWWTLGVLKQLTENNLREVILRLANPIQYGGDPQKGAQALNKLNQILMIEGLKVELDGVQPILKEITPQLKGETVTHDLKSDVEKTPKPVTRNILFMDLSNWSKLPADKVLDYLNKALPELAEIVRKHNAAHLNTWGDAFVATFGSTLEAAECALDIRQYFQRTPVAGGVPSGLRPRLSLHLGDVIMACNPITERLDIFGEAVHLTARLEPATPQGEIYCTENFANSLSAMRGLGPVAHPIGPIKLPKNFGQVQAFAVTGPGESAPSPPNGNMPTTSPSAKMADQVLSVTIDPSLSDWEKEGTWKPDTSRVPSDLQVTNSDRGGILVPTKSWTDYEFEFETKIDRDYTAWIIRAHDLDNYVMLQCGNGKITPHYRRDGVWWQEEERKLNQPLSGDWFKVCIRVEKDTVSVILLEDGQRTVLLKDDILRPRRAALTDGTLSQDKSKPVYSEVFVSYGRGGVGFRASGHESAYFRNITVRRIVDDQ